MPRTPRGGGARTGSDVPLHLHAELYQGQQPIEPILAEGTHETVVPPLDFERMWQV